MTKTLGWLHLSDLHFLDKHDWRNSPVLEKLLKDITALRRGGLQIDLVFCTGDIAFGETRSETLANQYADAKGYFDEILKICELPPERFFLVPGNHDIDRESLLRSQIEYFRSSARNPDQINQKFRDHDGEIQKAMERLSQYRQFVTDHYAHAILDKNINFGAWVEVHGVQVSIAGLNSSWTCADDEDKGQLWLAGTAQLNACKNAIQVKSGGNAADLRIGLIHHPLDWLNPVEAQQLRGRIENDFDFLLHGHAHDQWVKATTTPYHVVIASGAATAETEAEFGYNLAQLEPRMANIHLQCYDRKGDGWVKENVAGRVDNGIWPIQPPASFAVPATEIVEVLSLTPTPDAPNQADNISSDDAVGRGHFGLDDILARCSETLKNCHLLVLYGMAGVGKSVIAEELHLLPEWCGRRHISFTVNGSSGLADLFGALSPYLGVHDERPRPPVGNSLQEVAVSLRGMASQAAPFFLHVQRGQLWFSGGRWRREMQAIPQLLNGLVLAYPDSVIILETREQPEAMTGMEASGLPKEVLNDYFAHLHVLDGASWNLNKDQRNYVFQRLGGGHGRGAHGYGLYLLAQLAAAKGLRPDEVLKLHSDDYADALYAKLFRDLYENVLNETERNLLFACSLYRNGLHYSHLSRLETSMCSVDAGAALIRRRLLTEDSDWLYLHDLAAEQARMLAVDEARTRALQREIAGFWLTDLQGQRTMIEANIRRALEALHHLEQAGEGERITEIAPELFNRRPDEAAAILWRLHDQLFHADEKRRACVFLEYILKVSPDDHKAMRFLGEYRRKLYGSNDPKALELFRHAVQLHPTFPQYWANYGNAAIARGVDAIQAFLNEIENAPQRATDDYVMSIRATALQAAGRGEEASRLRMEKINAASRDAVFYSDEAKYLLDEKHDPDGALVILDKARSNGCANEYTESIRATALQAAGRGEEASRLRMEKINAASRNTAFYADEAKYLLDEKHDPDGALVILDKARSNGCADEYTESIRATALQAAGRGEEASRLRMEKINAASRDAVFYSDEAKYLLDEKHDPDGALVILDKARSNGCANEYTESIRATALQAAGRGEEASRLRMEKINAASRDAVFYSDEAKYLLDEKHDPDGALVILDKARSNGCVDEYTESIRATALQAAGRGEEASRLRMEKINAASRNTVFYSDEAKYLLDDKHDPDGALVILDKARSNGCADEYTESIRATALQAAGRGEEASRLRMEKINAASRDAVFYSDEAKYLLDEKHDPDGALVILDKARSNGCANEYTESIRATALQAVQQRNRICQ